MNMKKTLAITIILLFFIIEIASLIQGLVIEKSTFQIEDGNTLYVGGVEEGNYTIIQDAIDDASSGDTVFVYDDSSPYFENVIVDKTINLIGEDKSTTIIDGSKSGDVVYISAYRVNIGGFKLRNGSDGIHLYSDYNNITDNIISSNRGSGIDLRFSNSNTITGNIISNNEWNGINLLWGSSYNTITNNTISKNGEIPGSDGGIGLDWDSNHNIITGNTISNNDYDGINLNRANNNTITDNIIKLNIGGGLKLYPDSNNNIIINNTISNNNYGISIGMSENNTITGNTVNSNDNYGIHLWTNSNNNTIIENNINLNNGDGIYINNNILFIDKNIITKNIINSNNQDGIEIIYSNGNTITSNNISSNYRCGITLTWSSSNNIKQNNFIDNDWNSFFIGCKNKWRYNYWDRPMILPKLIFGEIEIGSKWIFWINIDWRPALKPYDI